MFNYILPIDYLSLQHLHKHIGDVKTVEYVCAIWNTLNPEDNLRIKRIDTKYSEIIITGKCNSKPKFLGICKILTSMGVLVTHEPTIISFTLEV